MTRLAELRALLAKATPAVQWHVDDSGEPGADGIMIDGDDCVIASFIAQDGSARNDTAIAVAAVNALPALLDVAEAAEHVATKLGARDGLEFMFRDASLNAHWKRLCMALAGLDMVPNVIGDEK